MAALTTDATFKDNGLKWNVRSYLYERVIDFSKDVLKATTNYEIGDLPAGFVPRNVAVIELVKTASAATVGVYLKSDSTKLAERACGTSDGLTVGQVTGKNLAGAGDTLAVAVSAIPASGVVKIAVSGDMMTDVWDDGLKRDSFDPAEHIPDTSVSA